MTSKCKNCGELEEKHLSNKQCVPLSFIGKEKKFEGELDESPEFSNYQSPLSRKIKDTPEEPVIYNKKSSGTQSLGEKPDEEEGKPLPTTSQTLSDKIIELSKHEHMDVATIGMMLPLVKTFISDLKEEIFESMNEDTERLIGKMGNSMAKGSIWNEGFNSFANIILERIDKLAGLKLLEGGK